MILEVFPMTIPSDQSMNLSQGDLEVYAAPTLVVYGKVSALTAAGSAGVLESGATSLNKKR